MDLESMINDKDAKLISQMATKKVLQAIEAVDVSMLKPQIEKAMMNDIESCLESNFLTDAVDWNVIGQQIGEIFSGIIASQFKTKGATCEDNM